MRNDWRKLDVPNVVVAWEVVAYAVAAVDEVAVVAVDDDDDTVQL